MKKDFGFRIFVTVVPWSAEPELDLKSEIRNRKSEM
jgi:hypothetical protein